MSKGKSRYSIPGKMIELLWTDNQFFSYVENGKKYIKNSFPKTDQWRDVEGFHMSFALAGYSHEHIKILCKGNMLTIIGSGMESKVDNEKTVEEISSEISDEDLGDEERNIKTSLNQGFVVRGIARRRFLVDFFVSEEFDLTKAHASMEHGLLHILIPPKQDLEELEIKIFTRSGDEKG